ncbi:beta-lactamase superfamily domain-containing protein [Mariannaea sp. PMI_226]|nr:beta-lactamase superfamily domain-containing protein [Mariannaea sp. PMI_226]
MTSNDSLQLSSAGRQPLLKSNASGEHKDSSTNSKSHLKGTKGKGDASVQFIGTATTIIEWKGIRMLTDPNFLHAGDHVHLGPGVYARRRTDPAIELADLPGLDFVLLSHYHEDHFDKLVEESLNRDFLIITTPHAKKCLTSKDDPFRNVIALDFFDNINIQKRRDSGHILQPFINITGMPGKHVPPGALNVLNEIIQAVPPTNGWMLEFGYQDKEPGSASHVGYRMYITGDTLLVDELKEIPKWLRSERIDLMLIHLGGTTIPGPSTPLLMVTMDAKQGVEMMKMMDADTTIPIHCDDYDLMLSSLDDFKAAVRDAGMEDRVVYLDRGEQYQFTIGGEETRTPP